MRKNIKKSILTIIIVFTSVTIILFSITLSNIFTEQRKKSLMQTTEFKLQLVSSSINTDISDVISLLQWSTVSSEMTAYLRNDNSKPIDSIYIYNRLQQLYQSNPSNHFIKRIVIWDNQKKLLQTGNAVISSTPIYLPWVLAELKEISKNASPQINIGIDTLDHNKNQCLILTQPIYLKNSNKGLAYISAYSKIITDKFKNYNLLKDDKLYLSNTHVTYEIQGSKLIKVTPTYTVSHNQEIQKLNEVSIYTTIKKSDNKKCMVVSYPLGFQNGWYLSHVIQNSGGLSLFSYPLFFYIFIALILLGFFLNIFLQRDITKPIYTLCNQLDTITKGDFTVNKDIEWKNELGDIGRGINKLSSDITLLMNNKLKEQKEKQELEYQILQDQIKPHFIYNTLNCIKWMAQVQGASGIEEITTAFSHLLKNASKNNKKLIPLEDEFSLLNDYCTIMQYRYGGNIIFNLSSLPKDSLKKCQIPCFTIQPIVENAVFHGVEAKNGLGIITIETLVREQELLISITDNGNGISQQQINDIFNPSESKEGIKDNKSIGILNVHKRIQFAFGPKYGLTIQSEENNYTKVLIHIPVTFVK